VNDTESSSEGQRLSKVVAAQVPCSRSQAEQYIAEGWVRIDGRTVEEPQHRVLAGQRVEVDPNARLQDRVPATFLVHKPAGMTLPQLQAALGAEARWSGDTTGIRRLKSHAVALAAPMPLPQPASGLVVFSQDPRILRKLRDDEATLEQELIAEVAGTIAPGGLERLGRGLKFEGRAMPPSKVSWQSETRLRFAVKGIAPDWVPWMCEQVGLELRALKRIRLGRVPLAGLPPGQWRYLGPDERF
jgi:23S rRNA pseudouridine2604 synthase